MYIRQKIKFSSGNHVVAVVALIKLQNASLCRKSL